MNAAEICEDLIAGRLTRKQAIEKLIAIGYDRALAEETVFIAMGGSDVIA